ncbi:MAG: hypothetical protein U0324_33565 [Polyangiales bacterium]
MSAEPTETAPEAPPPEAPPPQAPPPAPEPSPARPLPKGLQAWWFMLFPALAVVELIAQGVIQARVPTDADWRAARDHIARQKREGDLVTSAPLWTDPLARMHFRDLIALRDAARPDATRYARAWVATIRGKDNPDLAGWREASATSFGRVTVRLMVNPRPARVLYDFTEHVRPPDASAVRIDGETRRECSFQGGLFVAGGGLGGGMLPGPERFNCSAEGWNHVGVTIAEDMQHRGRRCIWSHPVQNAVMATTFHNVPMGTKLHGHHALAYEAERGDDNGNDLGGPVVLRVRVGDQVVGSDTHRDGEGWKQFEFDTSAFQGTARDVTFEVTSERAGMRHYCFEGDTR